MIWVLTRRRADDPQASAVLTDPDITVVAEAAISHQAVEPVHRHHTLGGVAIRTPGTGGIEAAWRSTGRPRATAPLR